MTKQETFDKMVGGVLAQGGPAMDRADVIATCKYRLGERKCAAGQLIPDDRYTMEMDKGGQLDNNVLVHTLLIGELGLDRDLIIAVQRAHDHIAMARDTFDDATFCVAFKERCASIAASFGLSAAGETKITNTGRVL